MTNRTLRRARQLAVAMLAAAASVSAAPFSAAVAQPGQVQPSAEPRGLTSELVYQILLAELAAQRGEFATAARAMVEVARKTGDAATARRATEVAAQAKDLPLAIEAARLWQAAEPDDIRPRRTLAMLLAADGRGREAKETLATWLAAEGTRAGDAFLQLARVLGTTRDRKAAFDLVRELAVPYAALPEAQFAVAQTGLGVEPVDDQVLSAALAAIDRALALRPNWDVAVRLKTELLARRAPAEAEAYLGEHLRARPDARELRSFFARFLFERKQYPAAREQLQELVRSNPGDTQARLALAFVEMELKQYAEAEKTLLELLAADAGDHGRLYLYLGQVSEEQRKWREAAQWYRKVEPGETWFPAQLRLAAALAKAGDVEAALAHLRGLDLDEDAQRVQVTQAEAGLLREAGRVREAFDLLEAGLASHPDAADLLYDSAMAAEKLGLLEVVETRLKRLIELKPDNAHAFNALGYTLVDRTSRVEEGLRYIEKAHALLPDDFFILDSLGWAHYRLGNLDLALSYLRRAFAGRPDPEIAAHLGEVLWVKGEQTEARALWQAALAEAPDHALLRETVRRLTDK